MSVIVCAKNVVANETRTGRIVTASSVKLLSGPQLLPIALDVTRAAMLQALHPTSITTAPHPRPLIRRMTHGVLGRETPGKIGTLGLQRSRRTSNQHLQAHHQGHHQMTLER